MWPFPLCCQVNSRKHEITFRCFHNSIFFFPSSRTVEIGSCKLDVTHYFCWWNSFLWRNKLIIFSCNLSNVSVFFMLNNLFIVNKTIDIFFKSVYLIFFWTTRNDISHLNIIFFAGSKNSLRSWISNLEKYFLQRSTRCSKTIFPTISNSELKHLENINLCVLIDMEISFETSIVQWHVFIANLNQCSKEIDPHELNF